MFEIKTTCHSIVSRIELQNSLPTFSAHQCPIWSPRRHTTSHLGTWQVLNVNGEWRWHACDYASLRAMISEDLIGHSAASSFSASSFPSSSALLPFFPRFKNSLPSWEEIQNVRLELNHSGWHRYVMWEDLWNLVHLKKPFKDSLLVSHEFNPSSCWLALQPHVGRSLLSLSPGHCLASTHHNAGHH